MNKYQDAYALVVSLYDSGDLSHDQANPILAALAAAGELEEAATKLADAARRLVEYEAVGKLPNLGRIARTLVLAEVLRDTAPLIDGADVGEEERMGDELIWWLSQIDCERIETIYAAQRDHLPDYIRRQLSSRYGRAGRGRLWVADGLRTESAAWDDGNPIAQLIERESCGGIVIRAADILAVQVLPGFITDATLTVVYSE